MKLILEQDLGQQHLGLIAGKESAGTGQPAESEAKVLRTGSHEIAGLRHGGIFSPLEESVSVEVAGIVVDLRIGHGMCRDANGVTFGDEGAVFQGDVFQCHPTHGY